MAPTGTLTLILILMLTLTYQPGLSLRFPLFPRMCSRVVRRTAVVHRTPIVHHTAFHSLTRWQPWVLGKLPEFRHSVTIGGRPSIASPPTCILPEPIGMCVGMLVAEGGGCPPPCGPIIPGMPGMPDMGPGP